VFAGDIDNPLSEKGIAQAYAIGMRLSKEKLQTVFCSDKQRARQTAKAIATCHGLVPFEHKELREIHHGWWEGKTKEEVIAANPDGYADWEDNPFLHAPDGGETCLQVIGRVLPLMAQIVAQHLAQGVNAAIVSHKAVLRLVVAHYLGVPYGLYRDRFDLDPASLSILEFNGINNAKLLLYNDTSHHQ
jgi:probable phosphoglycerate mutase